MNIVDIFGLIILVVFVYDGYKRGAVRILIELIISILSILCAIVLSQPLGESIKVSLGDYNSIDRIVAFLFAWVIIQVLFSIPYYMFLKKYPNFVENNKLNKISGGIITAFKSMVVFILFFAVINAIPVVNANTDGSILFDQLNNSLSNKTLGKLGTPISDRLSSTMKDLYSNGFGQANNGPVIGEQKDLGFTYSEGITDKAAEQKMFKLVNEERAKSGLSILTWDEKLAVVAREHSQDMLKRGYFSHNTPEGFSPFDRMSQANIKFINAGENLAFAITVDAAFQGLMLSTGHRANILSKDYTTIGIGAITAGKYGEMFTQTFASYASF